ncbi:MAG: hypothetical protein QOJ50_3919 [Cryptosporangiaceae bacterium]|nr:hypothetical protein [Cryptosporangiaceae bacterium]
MPAEPAQPYLLWSDYTSMIRRHIVLIALVVIAGTAAGAAGIRVAPRTYIGAAKVLVTPTGVGINNPGGNRAPAGVDLDTEAKLAKSAPVVSRVGTALRTSQNGLPDRLDVSVPPNSGVLRFAFAAPTPAEAATGANAFAKAYLDDRQAQAAAELERGVNLRRAGLASLQSQLKALPPPTGSDAAAIEARREVLTKQISTETDAVDALTNTRITPGRLLDPAGLPQNPIAPNKGVWLASGFSAALLVALALAMLRDRLARLVRRPDELERVYGLPVLATLRPDALAGEDLGAAALAHAAAELVAAVPPGQRLIAVAGASGGSLTGPATAALGAVLAHDGHEVLVVFAGVLDAALASRLGAGSSGLSNVVLDAAPPRRLARPVPGIPRLRVLGPGHEAGDAAERFADPGEQSLAALRAAADYTLLAAGTVMTTAETGLLAARADTTILAVELRRSTHAEVRRALGRVAGKGLLGAILSPPGGLTAPRSRRLEPASR